MLQRRISLILMLALIFPLVARAADEAFTQDRLNALNKAGKPVLVDIYADWCHTCKAQARVLDELLPQPEFKGITTLRVNFDTQKTAVNSFGAHYQSTLIVFKDGRETGRVTGETDSEKIAELLRKAL